MASGFSRKERADDQQPGRTPIAEAFTALLALEQGEPGAKPVRLSTGPEEPVITDALVDEVVRRVLERLAPDAARAVVVEVVSEVAERLVREEIARIRKSAVGSGQLAEAGCSAGAARARRQACQLAAPATARCLLPTAELQ